MKYKTISIVYVVLFLICLLAGIYLFEGWVQLFIDLRAPVFILPAFILLLLFSSGIKIMALAYFDAFTIGVVNDRVGRYKRGLGLVTRGGRLLFLWGGIGVLAGIFILVSNLNETAYIGSSIYFALSCLWLVSVCRALFVHPAATALEEKISEIEHANRPDPVHFDYDKFSPWAYLLLLLVLPVISVCLFLFIGADVAIFLSPEAFAIVPLSAVFIVAAGVGFKKIFAAFRTAMGKKSRTRYEMRQAAGILRRLGLVAIEMGVTGLVIKLIIMLAILEESEVIFGHFIMGLVPLFYGIYIAGALCFPLVNRLKLNRADDNMETKD